MSGSAHKNLQIFGRLCGNIPLPRTRLVTTTWDLAKDEVVARQRETQLTSTFWKTLIDEGAVVQRFHNSPASAWAIVDDLLSKGRDGDELLLQEELVEQRKRLTETEAGKVIYNRLQKLLAEQKKTLKELAEEAKLRNDPALAKSLQEEYDKTEAQLQKTFEEIKQMKIPLSRRILLWLFSRKPHSVSLARGLAPTWLCLTECFRKPLSWISSSWISGFHLQPIFRLERATVMGSDPTHLHTRVFISKCKKVILRGSCT